MPAHQLLRELVLRLGGNARSPGPFFPITCPAHNDSNPSGSIWLKNGKVRAKCFAGCSEQALLTEISRQTGMICPDGSFIAASAQAPEPRAEDIEAEIAEAKRAIAVQERIAAIWAKAQPVAEDGPVALYLRKTRGLDPPRIPATIRFSPSLWHGWSHSSCPAMLAQAVDAEGMLVGLHRTWLSAETANKAAVDPNRAALGPIKGGAIRLWDVEGSPDLLVAEGIETTLAAAQLAGWRYPAWAAISTSGLLALDVPRRFKRVAIMADNDANGVGEKAARILARRLRKRSVHAVIRLPSTVGEDWNDVLLWQLGRAA